MKIRNSLTTRLMINIGLIIIAMSAINLLWSVVQYQRQAQAEMKEKAAVIAQQLMATRAFIAEKQDIINFDEAGNFQFKHLNPAAVGKGLGHIFTEYTGYRLKQTSLIVRAAENAPDDFEKEQLVLMAADPTVKEVWGYDTIEDERVFRYLLPLYYTQECLPCHGMPAGETDIAGYAKEGKTSGEFAGAISVVFSAATVENNIRDNITLQLLYMLIILLLTIGSIYLIMNKIVIKPLKNITQKAEDLGRGDWDAHMQPENSYDEMRRLSLSFNAMADRLQNSYMHLEDMVEDRTRLLSEANQQLQEQSEELRKMNSLLNEADRLKSEFLAVMSHELRTPLTAIIAFTETLLSEKQNLTCMQQEYLTDIWESAQALHNQINDILDMSKIEAGLAGLDYQRFDMEKVLADLAYSLSPLFEKKNVLFTADIHPDTPAAVADYDKVKHIMQNLLSNAIKFTPNNGCIKLIVEPWHKEGEKGIQVQIKDNGIGIKKEDIPHIFDRFWQSSADGEKGSGNGLGLAIVKNFVELHGGWIKVDSELTQGTTFTFILPITNRGDEL